MCIVFSVKCYVQIFCLFFKLFFQLDDKSFVKYIFCEYFCPAYGSSIYFLNGVFGLPEVLVSMKFYYTIYFYGFGNVTELKP